MSDLQVVVVLRRPSGRKRTGGGYLGRSKKPTTRVSRPLAAGDRMVAEVLTTGWMTRPEIAAATGIDPNLLSPRLSRIGLYGAPEYVLLREGGAKHSGSGRGRKNEGGQPGTLTRYRVEKGTTENAIE